MNKRIQELYKQAYGYFPCPAGEPETEKFAELIVQECMNVLNDNELWNGHISNVLKAYFGVK